MADLSYLIFISESPLQTTRANQALEFVRHCLENNNTISQIFFYADGVDHGNGQNTISEQWASLSKQYQFPCYLCSSSVSSRQLLDNHHPSFDIAGLGQFVEAKLNSDRYISFGQQ